MEKSAREIDEKILKSSVVIVDVEGTTTSISFVKDVLFPYATEKVGNFLAEKWEVEGVQEAVEGMRQQALDDVKAKVEGAVVIPDKDAAKDEQIAGVASSLKWLISIDNKGTFMKKLSGLIWEQGYMAGDIKGHVYKDVQPALEAWRGMGKRVYVYSSGSVHAQRLLMRHSEAGDLSALFDGNFDTAVGHKQEVQSYANIIKEIGCQAEEALFLTDVVKEAAAAREAGLNTVLLVREGNAPLGEEDLVAFCTVQSFQDLAMQPSSTKRKQEPAEEELPPTKVAKTIPEGEEEKLQIECDKTEKIDNGAVTNENKASDDEAMEVDVADEKSEPESNDLPMKETKLEDPAVMDINAEEIIAEVKSDETPVAETKSDDKPIETKSGNSTEIKSDDKPVIVKEIEIDGPATETKSDDKPVADTVSIENSAVESVPEQTPVTEVKSDDAQSVVETESEEPPAPESKCEEKSESDTKSESIKETDTTPTPAVETKSEDKPAIETSEETSAKEPKSCDIDQPKIEETEALVADDCNQKTDIDKKSSDKDQVPEIMETDEEVSKDKKYEKIEDVNETAKKPKDVTSTPPLTDVANKDGGAICEKTENETHEKVINNSEEGVDKDSTEKLVEKVIEKSESKSDKAETKEVEDIIDEKKDSEANEKTDSKMDADETISEVPEKVVKPSEDMIVAEEVSESNVCSTKSGPNEEITSESELVTMETDIDDKLNELLGEEGVALEKECDEILSKVDEMTNKGLNSVKSFIEKAIAEKESAINEDSVAVEVNEDKVDTDVPSEVPIEDASGETLNNGKVSEMDTNVDSVPDKSLPDVEKMDSTTIETIPSVDDTCDIPKDKVTDEEKSEKSTNPKESSSSQETKANGENTDTQECVNGKTVSDEVNGQSSEESPSAEQKVQNGTSQSEEDKDKETPNVEDRLKGTNGTPAEDAKPAEPATEQIELKLKKVPTEDITAAEQAIEQVAET